jgi:serine/threonine protein kinase
MTKLRITSVLQFLFLVFTIMALPLSAAKTEGKVAPATTSGDSFARWPPSHASKLLGGRYALGKSLVHDDLSATAACDVRVARDTKADSQTVVIKKPQPHLDNDRLGRVNTALITEGAILKRIRTHKGALHLLTDLKTADDKTALVTEYCEGGDLHAVIDSMLKKEEKKKENTFLPEHVAVQILLAVASILEHAHSLGIAHRDIKLENIFFAKSSRLWSRLSGSWRLGSCN